MVCPAFARALAGNRADFNRRTLEARRHHPGFDGEAFTAFLTAEVDALVVAVAAFAPGRVDDVVASAYDIALELAGLRLIGPRARSPRLGQAWRETLHCLVHLLAHAPGPVIGTVCNAVLHLETITGARPAQWMRELAALAPRIASVDQLRGVGQVLAWRAGAAHYRAGALAAADALPEALALAALREPDAPGWAQLRARIDGNLWWRASADVADAAMPPAWEVGAFTGFGGAFATPPEVRSSGEHFVLRAGEHQGERHFLLLADGYGSSLLGASADEFTHAALASQALRFTVDGGELVVEGKRIALDLPGEGLAVCATAATLAISSRYTHAVRLVPR